MRRSFHRSFRSAPKRRKFEWTRSSLSTPVAANSGSYDLLAGFRGRLGGITNNLPDWTLVRLRGVSQFLAAQAATFDTMMITVGAIKWSTGGVGLPTPVATPHEDWIMWEPVRLDGGFLNAQAGLIGSLKFDNKSMRKLNQIDDTIFLVWESNNGAVTYTARHLVSAGFKLP